MSQEYMAQFILLNLRSNYSKPYGIQSMLNKSFEWEKCLWKRVDTTLTFWKLHLFALSPQVLDEKSDTPLIRMKLKLGSGLPGLA